MDKKKFSKQFNQLQVRINTIKTHFNFSPGMDGLTYLQSDKIRGMLLLCHAEFEAHIEKLALLLVDDALDKWQRTKKANYIMASLLSNSEKFEKKLDTNTKINQIVSLYRNSIIKNNHGIKQKNIQSMFNILGYNIDDFDSTFIASLESFGSDRGIVAHSSVKGTTLMYDKDTEFARIDNILIGIEEFQNVLLEKAN